MKELHVAVWPDPNLMAVQALSYSWSDDWGCYWPPGCPPEKLLVVTLGEADIAKMLSGRPFFDLFNGRDGLVSPLLLRGIPLISWKATRALRDINCSTKELAWEGL